MSAPNHSTETPSASDAFDPQSNQEAKSAVSQAASSVTDAGASKGSSAAQQTKSEVEKAADKLYEENMELEYAKREGGA